MCVLLFSSCKLDLVCVECLHSIQVFCCTKILFNLFSHCVADNCVSPYTVECYNTICFQVGFYFVMFLSLRDSDIDLI